MNKNRKEKKISIPENVVKAIPKRILVAEDNKTTQDLVSRFLEFLGFEVTLADNGIEALVVFLVSSFDLVLTDLQMPEMDGLSLAGNIKQRSPNTPVILLTGSDREIVRKKMEKGSFYSVLFKPFRLEDLQRKVQGALASGEREHQSVTPSP